MLERVEEGVNRLCGISAIDRLGLASLGRSLSSFLPLRAKLLIVTIRTTPADVSEVPVEQLEVGLPSAKGAVSLGVPCGEEEVVVPFETTGTG